MKLILIRHGLAFSGDLTLKGVHQVAAVATELTNQKMAAIYCSPAARCLQTLDEILRNRNDKMPIQITKLLGPKRKKESYQKLKARVELFLDDLKYDHQKEETVVVVSHQLVITMIILLTTQETRKLEHGEKIEIKVKVYGGIEKI